MNIIEEGMLVAIGENQGLNSRTLGVVTSCDENSNKFMVMVIIPSSSGKPIEYGKDKLTPIIQMDKGVAHEKDAKNIVPLYLINEIYGLRRALRIAREANGAILESLTHK